MTTEFTLEEMEYCITALDEENCNFSSTFTFSMNPHSYYLLRVSTARYDYKRKRHLMRTLKRPHRFLYGVIKKALWKPKQNN